MKKIKKSSIVCFSLAAFFMLAFIVFTIVVATVDRQPIGPLNSTVGLANLNGAVFQATGENQIFYAISKYVGVIPFATAFGFAVLGLVQSIKRKSLLKADSILYPLGALYAFIGVFYLLSKFILILNYRPVLIDGELEAAYPSSHTLMSTCVMGSAVIVIHHYLKSKKALALILDTLSIAVGATVIIFRLLSGVHWITDIIASLIISVSLLLLFYGFVAFNRKDDEKTIC